MVWFSTTNIKNPKCSVNKSIYIVNKHLLTLHFGNDKLIRQYVFHVYTLILIMQLVYLQLLQNETVKSNTGLVFVVEFLPSLTMTAISVVFPPIFEIVVIFEDYGPEVELLITMIRFDSEYVSIYEIDNNTWHRACNLNLRELLCGDTCIQLKLIISSTCFQSGKWFLCIYHNASVLRIYKERTLPWSTIPKIHKTI